MNLMDSPQSYSSKEYQIEVVSYNYKKKFLMETIKKIQGKIVKDWMQT